MAHFYFWHTLSALATSDTKGKWICIGHFVMSSVDSGIFVLLLLLKGQFTIAACDAIHERQKASHNSHTRMLLPRLFSVFFFFLLISRIPMQYLCGPPSSCAPHCSKAYAYSWTAALLQILWDFQFTHWENMCQCLTRLLHNSRLLCNTMRVYVLPLCIYCSHWIFLFMGQQLSDRDNPNVFI